MDLCDEVQCSTSLCDLSERVKEDESALINFINADPLQLAMQKEDILQAPDENSCMFADYSVRHDDFEIWSCASPSLADGGFFSDNSLLCGSVGSHSVEFLYHKSSELSSSLHSVSDASSNNELFAPNILESSQESLGYSRITSGSYEDGTDIPYYNTGSLNSSQCQDSRQCYNQGLTADDTLDDMVARWTEKLQKVGNSNTTPANIHIILSPNECSSL